jgi:hypothetical protein
VLRLHKLRMDHYIAEGDGNCQFRSVSFGLYGRVIYQSVHLYSLPCV